MSCHSTSQLHASVSPTEVLGGICNSCNAFDALSNPPKPTELIIIKEVHNNIIFMPAESFCWVFYTRRKEDSTINLFSVVWLSKKGGYFKSLQSYRNQSIRMQKETWQLTTPHSKNRICKKNNNNLNTPPHTQK